MRSPRYFYTGISIEKMTLIDPPDAWDLNNDTPEVAIAEEMVTELKKLLIGCKGVH
jgi:hypothetical protein